MHPHLSERQSETLLVELHPRLYRRIPSYSFFLILWRGWRESNSHQQGGSLWHCQYTTASKVSSGNKRKQFHRVSPISRISALPRTFLIGVLNHPVGCFGTYFCAHNLLREVTVLYTTDNLGSRGRIRTYTFTVNSRAHCRYATREQTLKYGCGLR